MAFLRWLWRAVATPSALEVPPAVPIISHLESIDCWCRPDVFALCPECGDLPFRDLLCWRCAGRGMIPFDGWAEGPLHIVHHAMVPGR